jgi:hypothetical protein
MIAEDALGVIDYLFFEPLQLLKKSFYRHCQRRFHHLCGQAWRQAGFAFLLAISTHCSKLHSRIHACGPCHANVPLVALTPLLVLIFLDAAPL